MSIDLSKNILDLLKTIARAENVKDYELKINEGSSKGDGYLSRIVSVSIESKSHPTLDLILKIAPEFNKSIQNNTFQREIYVYEKIVPAFRKFLKENNGYDLDCVAKCYGSISDKGKECLVFENLKSSGYKMWPRQIPPTDDHVKLVFEEYAKYHAISFAMRSKHPKEFEDLVSQIKNPSMENKGRDDPDMQGFINAFHKNAVTVLQGNEKLLAAFEDYWNERRLDFCSFYGLDANEYFVVPHGDPWLNNILFKYEDKLNPDKPTSLKLVDFQMTTLYPPVIDLAVFFCSSYTQNLRLSCQNFLDFYYDSLSESLKKFGCDSKVLYPREVFEKQWQEWRMFGLFTGLMFIKLLVTEDEETADLSSLSGDQRSDHMQKELKNQAAYNKRIYDLIKFMYENKWM